MNSDEITHILKHLLAHSRARFLGVFASDKLPPLNTIQSLIPCCYVSNIDPTGKGGSHWVAFFHSRPNRLEFFDSYGRHPCEFGFSFPKSLQIFYNPYQIQAFGTQVCGHFCIYILYPRAHNYALNSICKRFSILPIVRSASIVSSFIRNAHERINKK